jgi:hypothetical protein
MLNDFMLNVVMLNVVMLNVIMLNAIMLSVIMLNVILLSVVAPKSFISNIRKDHTTVIALTHCQLWDLNPQLRIMS